MPTGSADSLAMPDDTQDAKAQKLAAARKKVEQIKNIRDVDTCTLAPYWFW